MSAMSPTPELPIRVLVVEDSPVARELLVHVLNDDPQLRVVGVAGDGEAAVEAAQRLHPDVVLMDIHLPKLDGFAATRQIMESAPTRIVLATSTSDPKEVAANFRAVEAGALAVLAKPAAPGQPGFAEAVEELLQTLKLMSEVRVVKRWPRRNGAPPPEPVAPVAARPVRIVAVGASTGGPLALQALLSALAAPLPAPIVIVQHIADSFVEGLVDWLAGTTRYSVQVAAEGDSPKAGVAYLAPGGRHLQVRANGTLELVDTPKEHGVRPAASVLFRSVTAAYGAAAAGVLLTGMGRDGAQELRAMRDAGALTIAQDRDSSVIFGMPGVAIGLDAAAYVLPPDKIGSLLENLFRPSTTANGQLHPEGRHEQ